MQTIKPISLENWRQKEQERIKKRAEKYKAHLEAENTGKEQIRKIAADSKLARRFLAGTKLPQMLAYEHRGRIARKSMADIKKSRLLAACFINSSISK